MATEVKEEVLAPDEIKLYLMILRSGHFPVQFLKYWDDLPLEQKQQILEKIERRTLIERKNGNILPKAPISPYLKQVKLLQEFLQEEFTKINLDEYKTQLDTSFQEIKTDLAQEVDVNVKLAQRQQEVVTNELQTLENSYSQSFDELSSMTSTVVRNDIEALKENLKKSFDSLNSKIQRIGKEVLENAENVPNAQIAALNEFQSNIDTIKTELLTELSNKINEIEDSVQEHTVSLEESFNEFITVYSDFLNGMYDFLQEQYAKTIETRMDQLKNAIEEREKSNIGPFISYVENLLTNLGKEQQNLIIKRNEEFFNSFKEAFSEHAAQLRRKLENSILTFQNEFKEFTETFLEQIAKIRDNIEVIDIKNLEVLLEEAKNTFSKSLDRYFAETNKVFYTAASTFKKDVQQLLGKVLTVLEENTAKYTETLQEYNQELTELWRKNFSTITESVYEFDNLQSSLFMHIDEMHSQIKEIAQTFRKSLIDRLFEQVNRQIESLESIITNMQKTVADIAEKITKDVELALKSTEKSYLEVIDFTKKKIADTHAFIREFTKSTNQKLAERINEKISDITAEVNTIKDLLIKQMVTIEKRRQHSFESTKNTHLSKLSNIELEVKNSLDSLQSHFEQLSREQQQIFSEQYQRLQSALQGNLDYITQTISITIQELGRQLVLSLDEQLNSIRNSWMERDEQIRHFFADVGSEISKVVQFLNQSVEQTMNEHIQENSELFEQTITNLTEVFQKNVNALEKQSADIMDISTIDTWLEKEWSAFNESITQKLNTLVQEQTATFNQISSNVAQSLTEVQQVDNLLSSHITELGTFKEEIQSEITTPISRLVKDISQKTTNQTTLIRGIVASDIKAVQQRLQSIVKSAEQKIEAQEQKFQSLDKEIKNAIQPISQGIQKEQNKFAQDFDSALKDLRKSLQKIQKELLKPQTDLERNYLDAITRFKESITNSIQNVDSESQSYLKKLGDTINTFQQEQAPMHLNEFSQSIYKFMEQQLETFQQSLENLISEQIDDALVTYQEKVQQLKDTAAEISKTIKKLKIDTKNGLKDAMQEINLKLDDVITQQRAQIHENFLQKVQTLTDYVNLQQDALQKDFENQLDQIKKRLILLKDNFIEATSDLQTKLSQFVTLQGEITTEIEKITETELSNTITTLIESQSQLISEKKNITLELSNQSIQRLQQHVQELIQQLSQTKEKVTIIADKCQNTLLTKTANLETTLQNLDNTAKKQLNSLQSSLSAFVSSFDAQIKTLATTLNVNDLPFSKESLQAIIFDALKNTQEEIWLVLPNEQRFIEMLKDAKNTNVRIRVIIDDKFLNAQKDELLQLQQTLNFNFYISEFPITECIVIKDTNEALWTIQNQLFFTNHEITVTTVLETILMPILRLSQPLYRLMDELMPSAENRPRQ